MTKAVYGKELRDFWNGRREGYWIGMRRFELGDMSMVMVGEQWWKMNVRLLLLACLVHGFETSCMFEVKGYTDSKVERRSAHEATL